MVVRKPVSVYAVPPVLWKNGGGTTRTLAVEPENAGLGEFAWRISLAEINASGSFSAFPGIDRRILLWKGEGVVLHSPAWPSHALTERLRPFDFRGEDEVRCELVQGSSEDLNLMVQRARVKAAMHILESEVTVDRGCDDLFLLCATGSLKATQTTGTEFILEEQHFVRISELDTEIRLVPQSPESKFVCVTLRVSV